jgi:hypothetical protein
MQIIQEEYDRMLDSEKKECLNESVISEASLSQSEVALASIESAINSTLSNLLKSFVPETEIKSMVDSAADAVSNRVRVDLENIYDERSTPLEEIVMTQEPMDILEELRSLTNKLSSISGNTQPLENIASDMIIQINDLEEILTTENE